MITRPLFPPPEITARHRPRTTLQPVAPQEPARAWRRERDEAHRVFAERAQHLAEVSTSGRRSQPLARDFLRNPQVRLSAALRVLGDEPERAAAYALRQRISPWAEQWPAIPWFPKAKPNGSARPICDLPLELKAVHIMLAAAIAAQMRPTASLYGIRGYGRDDAARALKALQNAGFTSLAKVDIVDCFQSINPEALYQLPIPKEVIRTALDPRNLTFIRRRTPRGYSEEYPSYDVRLHSPSGPRGLIQGSPVSNIILAWLLNGLPQSKGVAVLLCFDNIAVAARDNAGCRAMVDTLADYLGRCPAGPLALCPAVYADNTPMEFLGYLFDPERLDVGVADGARGKFERRLGSAEEADIADPANFPLRTWHALRDFANGFPAVENLSDELAHYVATSQDVADASGSPLVQYLHQHILAPRGTPEGEVLHALLKTHPRGSVS